jgi:hypothetical protein
MYKPLARGVRLSDDDVMTRVPPDDNDLAGSGWICSVTWMKCDLVESAV